jgi:hypothetical protein
MANPWKIAALIGRKPGGSPANPLKQQLLFFPPGPGSPLSQSGPQMKICRQRDEKTVKGSRIFFVLQLQK